MDIAFNRSESIKSVNDFSTLDHVMLKMSHGFNLIIVLNLLSMLFVCYCIFARVHVIIGLEGGH